MNSKGMVQAGMLDEGEKFRWKETNFTVVSQLDDNTIVRREGSACDDENFNPYCYVYHYDNKG